MNAVINGANIYYVERGDPSNMPVMFVHGFPFSHEMWVSQLEEVGKEYLAVAYDIRGHGKSEVGDGQYTMEGHVDDLLGLLDHLEIEKVVIAGLSMGGYISLRALERNPDRFLAAVLCDTRSVADTDEGKVKRASDMKAVKKGGSRRFAEGYVEKLFAPGSFKTRTDETDAISRIVGKTSPVSIAGNLLAMAARTDTTASLSRIKVPTLILVGEYDLLTPPAESQAMAGRIKDSELHIVPKAAHMSNLENPDFFNEKLLDFLNRVSQMSR